MDSAITRAEHEEFVKRMDSENNRLGKRIGTVEKTVGSINDLTISVERMAVSIENMVREQRSQNERLEKLEGKDGETWKTVKGCIITGVVSLLLGFLAAQIS